jgi:hypothetical protein
VRSIRYHSEARSEFLSQVDYYARLSLRLAERFDRAVVAAEALAAESPDHWPPYTHKTRRVLDRQFKFSLVYLHTDREIVVIAIAPFRRRPGYWNKRIGNG